MIIEIAFITVVCLIILINIILRFSVNKLKAKENKTNLSGFEIIRMATEEFNDLHIIKKNSRFLDYYNKSRNVVVLSPEVFDDTNAYSGLIAINIALQVKIGIFTLIEKIISFIVLLSYIFIILGALANNYQTIYLGMILFIITFICELLFIYSLIKSNYLDNLKNKTKFIKPSNIYNSYNCLMFEYYLATFFYRFIIYFK